MSKKVIDEKDRLFDAAQALALAKQYLHKANYRTKWDCLQKPNPPKRRFFLEIKYDNGRKTRLSLEQAKELLSGQEWTYIQNAIALEVSSKRYND